MPAAPRIRLPVVVACCAALLLVTMTLGVAVGSVPLSRPWSARR